MVVLEKLQRIIERLNGARIDLDVRSYLVDTQTRDSIPGARDDLPEQLFVRHDEEGVEVALYIDPQIVSSLERDEPHRRLHGGNLEPYCVALEGVSHFVMLVWRATLGRPVSHLELEIQAEVDKFVSAWLLLEEQGQPLHRTGSALVRQLFDRVVLHDLLEESERRRYHLANSVARRFCANLIRRHGRRRDRQRIEKDARAFFRTGLSEKMRAA